MQNNIAIPHFHGLNLNEQVTEQERLQSYNYYKNGGVPYYSEIVLENAFIDKERTNLREYEIKLLDDFYVREVENTFSNPDILSYDKYIAFIHHYVNFYKGCYGKTNENSDPDKLKNIYRDLEKSFAKIYNAEPTYQKYIAKNLNLYSLKVKNEVEDLYEEINERRIAEKIDRLMKNNTFDIFIAMSKLPMHPIKFALGGKDNFERQFEQFKTSNEKYRLFGLVFCSLQSENEYENEVHYDVLQTKFTNSRLKLYNRYLNQLEVDFHKIKANNLKFALPIILIKENIDGDTRQKIMQDYGLTNEQISKIQSLIIDRRFCAPTYNNPKTVFEKVNEFYSHLIFEKVENTANDEGKNLQYVKPDGNLADFNENLKSIQKNILDQLEQPNNQVQDMRIEPTQLLTLQELRERLKKVGKDIFRLAGNETRMDNIRNMLNNSEDYLPMEKYETTCLDRILIYNNPKITMEEKDKKLARNLQKIEDRRFIKFNSDNKLLEQQFNIALQEFFENIENRQIQIRPNQA